MSSTSSSSQGGAALISGGRKRTRENNGAAPTAMQTDDGHMMDAGDDGTDDVEMDTRETYDELDEAMETHGVRTATQQHSYVPFYPHLGGDDFDDE